MADIEFKVYDGTASVILPGGLVLSSAPVSPVPTDAEAVRVLFGQLSAALAPLTPVLQLVGFVQAVMDVVQAIPDAIGPPPNPGGLIAAIGDVVEKGDVILAFNPTTAIPVLFRSVVGLLRLFASGLSDELDALADQKDAADQVRALAQDLDGDAQALMLEAADCGDQTVSEALRGLQASLGGFSSVLDAVAVLSSIVPVPALPALDLGGSVQEARDAVQAFESALDAISV